MHLWIGGIYKGDRMKKWLGKILILLFIVAIVVGYQWFGLGEFLSFEYLKAQQESLQNQYLANKSLFIAIYLAIYIISTAVSIPGATILTLAGGAIFGLWFGLLLVSFASTIGATLAFLGARFLLRDWVRAKFGDKLKSIDEGVEKEGAFYLFTLRLVPVVPFFFINLSMGLTKMNVIRYFIVSQIGMLPGTVVYVNAGTQLAQLESASGIFSPQILGSFALIGIFPLVAKKFIEFLKARKNEPNAKA